jgi:transposase
MLMKEDNRPVERAAEGPTGFPSPDVRKSRPERTRPNPELVERARRRQFTPEYKLRIVEEADACTGQGEVGALLRREGLYSSHLSEWRKQHRDGALAALSRMRGRPKPNPLERENAELRRRAERAEAELTKARKVIEVQGNVSALLGELLKPRGAESDESTE